MKKSKFILFALLFSLAACGQTAAPKKEMPSIDVDTYTSSEKKTGDLGAFDLVSPTNGMIVDSVNEFSWGASENAESYTLEICSNVDFIKNVDTVDYYSKENIKATTFKVYSQFAFKDTTYYWKVTAKNSKETKESTSVFTFFIQAPEIEEYKFDIGEADDWRLHPDGSYADISIDNTNFFGNDEESLVISFKMEDTKRGVPSSDGWIIVTKTIEKSIYGTDSLFFNMYYSGQDATIIIRLVDRDNEYWYCPVQVSNNAKQSVFLQFSDFIQRKGDVTVANQEFDYERIKYFEVVFEKSFGDGIFLMSDVRAVKFHNYENLFIKNLNFSKFDSSYVTMENYNFEYTFTEDEMTMNYYGTVAGKPKINGYGFLKLNVNRYLYPGDAIKVSIKYTGSKGTNVLFRIYEEDTDRWSYKVPFSALPANEYKDVVIPYAAFAKSSILGDGKRQFYYIINLQFGLEGIYGTGTLSWKDFEIVKVKDYITEPTRLVAEDGLIEDFSSYKFAADMYFIWTATQVNKDEYLNIESSARVAGDRNTVCGQFQYKADMEQAKYYIPISTAKTTYKSLSMWLSDKSMKSGNERATHVTNWSPETIIYIRLNSGEIYANTSIKSLATQWHEYVFPFSSFEITNPKEVVGAPQPIRSENITHVGIGFQYYYKDVDGKTPAPTYSDDNPVLIDYIKLSEEDTYRMTIKEKYVTPTATSSETIANIDDFEDGVTSGYWTYNTNHGYEQIAISNDVSSEGGTKSLSLQHKPKSSSPSYYLPVQFDPSVNNKVFYIDMKGEVNAKVYLNFYTNINGTEKKYRVEVDNIGTDGWYRYTIGLSKFIQEGSSTTMSMSTLKNVVRLSIGMDYYGEATGNQHILIDNVRLGNSPTSYDTFTRTKLA